MSVSVYPGETGVSDDTRFRARAMAHGPRMLDAIGAHLERLDTIALCLQADGDAATAQTLRDISEPIRELNAALSDRSTL